MMNSLSNYKKKMEQEIAHYRQVFKERLSQEVPNIWNDVEKHFSECIFRVNGMHNLYEFVAVEMKNRKKVKILGLGSGACGNELDGIAPLLQGQKCDIELYCVDINDDALRQASTEAEKRGISFKAITMDANKLELEENTYDVIVAYASLHHFVELDHITREINKGLKVDGIFVTVDIPTRNGYKMWFETHEIVNRIWKTLPKKYKIDHTGYAQPTYVDYYPNIDYSENSFECINSEAIIPSLRRNMIERSFVPSLSIARRFFDTKFGPNYDLREPLDRSIFDFVMKLDNYFLENQILKPETFFGAYGKKLIDKN